ncbi:MAG TPA: hypothetical protein VLM91_16915, partial [Candidatus Methylomirabilis sp.]|nr:hypothetical protein [Candidatus Methylomirabilis sp.]
MIQRTRRRLGGLLLIGLLLVVPPRSVAQTFTSGSTGADGPFNPTGNTTLTLPPNGVFNFTTINIPAGVTVTFTRNAANTPVILLATGNVTINGVLDVSGGVSTSYGRPGPGGPGGFDGGAGADGITTATGGPGLGTGGGAGATGTAGGGGGGCGIAGTSGYVCSGIGCSGTGGGGGPAYGTSALRPILGGSGGGGGGGTIGTTTGGGGGGGGGAIVVASSGTIYLNSLSSTVVIRANGSAGGLANGGNGGSGGGGSGGAIRVIAPTITGYGQLVAQGGSGSGFAGPGATGRIRVEAATLTYTGFTTPLTTISFPQPVFPGTGQPGLTIASVGGIPAPVTPSGSLLAAPDILLPTGASNPVEVLL